MNGEINNTGGDNTGAGNTGAEPPTRKEQWQRLNDLVNAALDRPAAEREAFLAESCPDDADLRATARAMLEAHADTADDFLTWDALPDLESVASSAPAEDALLGATIGSFTIQSTVASGGMGTVYRAIQSGTGQTVALKVMRAGLANESWRQRFAHEVRVLAQLQHAAIAQIFDAGVHRAEGHAELPYFAMEFVEGLPLTRFVAEHDLDQRQIVQLMIRICEGVHHAHQRGIIHRDLKPDNVLVVPPRDREGTSESDTELDGIGIPKIVDFGIARAVDPDEQADSKLTQAGQVIGTMAYMSPEQTTGDPDDVDIRCDVYALGVILYEVLSGQKPYRLDRASLGQAAQIILEVTPPRLGSLSRELGGDLETIAAMALEKEPARRYASASELAADLRRFLDDEPILARPPSALYQLRKFARRKRGLVIGLAVAFVVFVAGAVGTVWNLLDAIEQGEAARVAAAAEKKAAREAKEERDKARIAEQDARDVSRFLYDMLESADLGVAGRELSAKELLDRNAARIDTAFPERSRVRAELHSAFGWDYFTFGDYAAAERHLRQSFTLSIQSRGRNDPQTIAECTRLCQVLEFAGKLDEAYDLLTKNETIALRHLERTHEFTLFTRSVLASVTEARGDAATAEKLFREVLADQKESLGLLHDFTLSTMNGLGNLLLNTGKYGEAEVIFEKVVRLRERYNGLEHAKTLVPLSNWAMALSSQGRYKEAAAKYEIAIRAGKRVWNENHPDLLSAESNLAAALSSAHELERAVKLQRELYERYRKLNGDTHADTIRALNNLCITLIELKKFDEADTLIKRLIVSSVRLNGAEHPNTARMQTLRAEMLSARIPTLPEAERSAAVAECRAIHEASLATLEKHLGRLNPVTIIARNNLGAFLRNHNQKDAIAVLAQVVADWAKAVPDAPSVLRLFRQSYGKALRAVGRYADAEREFLEAWELPPHPKASPAELAKQIALLYEAWGKPKKATEWRKR